MPRRKLGLDAADWLSLAAAPTFATMALLTAALGGGTHGASPLTGMALMYLLMAAFHSVPWLKLKLQKMPPQP